jgi:hypothetical protein
MINGGEGTFMCYMHRLERVGCRLAGIVRQLICTMGYVVTVCPG